MTKLIPFASDASDEAIAFMSDANPFAQETWGWDTGRFIDWRWGPNAAKEAQQPGWFEENCAVVRSSGRIESLVISEYGRDDLCIITREPQPELVLEILRAVVEERRRSDRVLELVAATGAQWLRDLFAGIDLQEHPDAGHAWEYDLTIESEPAPVPPGFSITSLADGMPGDHEGIAECVAAAFRTTHDVERSLRSIEDNPLFRPEMSVFARSPDGRVAAYCRGTVDPRNGISSIDPVCTHPDFQRLGLGKAIVLACFESQRKADGQWSYIGSAPDPAPGNRLYRALGPSRRIDMSTWKLVAPGGPTAD